ncbi:MAG: 2OG-Fe(II) oxygenase family protein [Aestuariibacter sp.]
MSDITNDFIDVVKARRDFRDFGWAEIADIWIKSFTESVIQNVVRNVKFLNCFRIAGEHTELSDEQLKALSGEQQQQLFQQIHTAASQGNGYLYARRAIDDNSDKIDVGALHQAFAWLKSEATLDLIKDITGKQDIITVSCMATRFSQGQFITREKASDRDSANRLGFIIDLSPHWQSDWGGLLQLHSTSMANEPASAFTPAFNSLLLFDAGRDFSLSYVAPFIKYYRYTLMGWFSTSAHETQL